MTSTKVLLQKANYLFPGIVKTTPIAMLSTRSTIFWTCFQYISHHHYSLSSCCFTFTVSALSGKTSAPTKVLGTNKLLTTYRADPKDAPAQPQTFMRAMSSHKWLNVLCDNDLLAGFYVVSSTKCIKVCSPNYASSQTLTLQWRCRTSSVTAVMTPTLLPRVHHR